MTDNKELPFDLIRDVFSDIQIIFEHIQKAQAQSYHMPFSNLESVR